MADLALARAYIELTTKGNIRDLLAKHKSTVTRLTKDLESGYYLSLSKLSVQMEKTMKGLGKRAHFEDLVAQHGPIGAELVNLQEHLKGVQEALEPIGRIARNVFLVGTAAVTGFVAAASPDTFSTWIDSLKLLSATIGQAFLPYIARMAFKIQELARWVKGLSAEEKDHIANLVIWAIGIAGVIMLLPKLVAAIQLAVAAVKALNVAMMFMLTNPLALALLPIAAAVAAMGLAFYGAKKQIDGMIASVEDVEKALRRPSDAMTRKDLTESEVYKKAQAMLAAGKSKEEVNTFLADEQKRALAEERRANENLPQLKAEAANAKVLAGPMGERNPMFGAQMVEAQGRAAEAQATALAAAKRADEARLARLQLTQGQQFAGGGKVLTEQQANDQNRINIMADPQFMAVADAWKQLQIAAAKGQAMDLQGEILKMQIESRDQLINIKQNTDRIPHGPVGPNGGP